MRSIAIFLAGLVAMLAAACVRADNIEVREARLDVVPGLGRHDPSLTARRGHDAQAAAVTVAALTNPTYGEVITAPDKQLIYRPDPGFFGTDMFTYWATDGAGNYAPATVRVEVQAP